jgi:hypothetical protein
VVIAAEPDGPGRRTARDAWIRWRAEGREVRVGLPDGSDDFNDLLQKREAMNDASGFSMNDEPPPESPEETITRLARLPELEYGRVRIAEAKRIGVPVGAIERPTRTAAVNLKLHW